MTHDPYLTALAQIAAEQAAEDAGRAVPAEWVQRGDDDPCAFFKGVVAGLCLVVPLWLLIAAAVAGVMR